MNRIINCLKESKKNNLIILKNIIFYKSQNNKGPIKNFTFQEKKFLFVLKESLIMAASKDLILININEQYEEFIKEKNVEFIKFLEKFFEVQKVEYILIFNDQKEEIKKNYLQDQISSNRNDKIKNEIDENYLPPKLLWLVRNFNDILERI